MELCGEYPVSAVCRALGVARSSVYYRRRESEETALKTALAELAGRWPTYGYRRLTVELRRAGMPVNGKRVRRLMHELGLVRSTCRGRRTTNSAHGLPRYPNLVRDLEVDRPDQVWVADITYVALRKERVYLAIVMDMFTRTVRGWHLGRTLDAGLTIAALEMALSDRRPETHHSDQGVQYADRAYTGLLDGVAISMAGVGRPTENGYAERLIRTVKEEEVALSDYDGYAEARIQIGRFLDDVYRHKRIHSALGYLTPAEFEHNWHEQNASDLPKNEHGKSVQLQGRSTLRPRAEVAPAPTVPHR